MELFAGSVVTDLGLEVLTLGGQMEGVDLDPLLRMWTVRRVVFRLPVHCETRCPLATLCLRLPSFSSAVIHGAEGRSVT